MILKLLKKIFGTKNERVLRSLQPIVVRVNELEKIYAQKSQQELIDAVSQFRQQVSNGRPLSEIECDVYAIVRVAADRTLKMRHFDVQVLGGAVLHRGAIAEMKTGEGKTLVATLPACLNSLTGKPVYIVTVNDYLAKRDAEWMGEIYRYLGFSVGVIYSGDQSFEEKKRAYQCDIVYGQNNEFAFDYLRDNMRYSFEDVFQKHHFFAIVDEVDSILIDEARTPLIISGPADDPSDKYLTVNKIIPDLVENEDYQIELKSKFPYLTEAGVSKVEKLLNIDNLYDPKNIDLLHIVQNCLKAHKTLHKDQDYVVRNGRVVIVDEFTGRLMEGRRWSGGLHQAVEAKEGVKIQKENVTLASITFQNYFRLFEKLSGMTGTADTEAEEFKKIYNLDVVVIPTHKKMIRVDEEDRIFATREEKYRQVIEDIKDCYTRGQPVLVGTTSIEQSEKLSALLLKEGIPHNVLNAKHHAREAEIVAQAGRYKAVTISTNMAGRGTDIILGGNPEALAKKEVGYVNWNDEKFLKVYEKYKKICEEEREKVVAAGGLMVLGTERHESRRIDDQLRGRSGRQGDPGRSRFFVSFEDDLLVRFMPERLPSYAQKFKGETHAGQMVSWLTRTAQKKVENYHFEIRKHLLDYDNVYNNQRKIVYDLRSKILKGDQIQDILTDFAFDLILDGFGTEQDPKSHDHSPQLDLSFLGNELLDEVKSKIAQDDHENLLELVRRAVEERLTRIKLELEQLDTLLKNQNSRFSANTNATDVLRLLMLEELDKLWINHLQRMDQLKEGIGFRGYAFKNPVYEFQKEGFRLFKEFIHRLKYVAVRNFFTMKVLDENLLENLRKEEEKHKKILNQAKLSSANNQQQNYDIRAQPPGKSNR
ncbi:MAG: preprotein translocase subunit SecA [Deltaproteobacteria bacterium]|nr:preprotein translocase subunit SecA [Deltaproteobacteria bacterium]